MTRQKARSPRSPTHDYCTAKWNLYVEMATRSPSSGPSCISSAANVPTDLCFRVTLCVNLISSRRSGRRSKHVPFLVRRFLRHAGTREPPLPGISSIHTAESASGRATIDSQEHSRRFSLSIRYSARGGGSPQSRARCDLLVDPRAE